MVSEERKLYTDEYGTRKYGLDHKNNFKRQKMDFIFYAEVDRESCKDVCSQGLVSVWMLKHNESLFTLSVKSRKRVLEWWFNSR